MTGYTNTDVDMQYLLTVTEANVNVKLAEETYAKWKQDKANEELVIMQELTGKSINEKYIIKFKKIRGLTNGKTE